MQIHKGLGQVLLQDCCSFQGILGFTPLLLGGLLHHLEEDVTSALILHLQQSPGTLTLLLCQLEEEVDLTLQSHKATVEIETVREVGA